MTTEKFEELYKRLNPAQKEAVDWIEGPVMVVAGPGTGKTQILTLRIANILRKTDVEPKNILALTFTESGAVSMRRRLAEIIGSPAYAVVISTFHSFCNEVIRNYPEEFPRIVGSQSITEVDQIGIVKGILDEQPLRELKPFGDPFYYLRSVVSRINDLKREGIGPEKFSEVVSKEQVEFDMVPDLRHERGPHAGKMKGEYQRLEKKIAKNRELAGVYQAYEERLAKNRFYDYSDMVMEVLRALERNDNLRLILQEQHQYLLVDEHQDTNNAQNRVIELLAAFHENPNLFVVGDVKQAIYRFQGASIENFAYFRKRYPEAKLVRLSENYRSSQLILDSAESLIKGEESLVSRTEHSPAKIRVLGFSRPDAENFFLAKDIGERLARGTLPQDIAVLYRDNKDAFAIARAFEKRGIPFVIESDRDLLTDPDLRKLMLIFRTIDSFGENEPLAEALHIDFLGIPPLDVYKLIEFAHRSRRPLYEIIRSTNELARAGVESAENIHALYRNLSGFATAAKNQYLPEFFEWVVRESGFLGYLLRHDDPADALAKLSALFDEAQELVEVHREYRLADFMNYIDLLSEHGILLRRRADAYHAAHVRLMTAHKAKGLEFGHVYLAGVADGHWGNKRSPDVLPLLERVYAASGGIAGDSARPAALDGGADKLADERRLFYVALTRAKHDVTVTYSRTGSAGREQLPSVFLEELRPELLMVEDTKPIEAEFGAHPEARFAAPEPSGAAVNDAAFIRELFSNNGLSVTALNNYLDCPWKYFYTNLLRIPKAKEPVQLYGTAVHEALRDFFANTGEGLPSKEFLLQAFTKHLGEQPLAESEHADALARGKTALGGYWDRYHATWRTNVLTEFNISGVFLTPEIRLTGKIDKLEFLGAGTEVNVVDYKTGRPKSRRDIEGETAASRGDIKRQLVFYNLLLNLHEERKYRMVSGEIDFVQPDEKGRYHTESFTVTPAEIAELEALAVKVSGEILSLAFWDKRCEKKECEFCALREMMK